MEVGRSRVSVSFGRPMLVLGSCFADSIGRRMGMCGFDVVVNPLGTTYNPLSVVGSLGRVVSGRPFVVGDCVRVGAGDGRVCSFSHHTRHARGSEEEFLEHANGELSEAHRRWGGVEVVIVTLGTAWCFRHNVSGEVVTNCLKRPGGEFTRFRLSVGECVAALEDVVSMAGGRDVIFTVSPIRHLADGAHGNAVSKATLLMAVEEVVGSHGSGVEYFPSFEIVCDELRDYRFYADDMTHPTSLAETYIFERFMDFGLPEGERAQLEANIKLAKRQGHREGQVL